MNVVLANGDFKTIDSNSDLWWGMQGAGHNFAVVTSVTAKIYDIEHYDWAIETIVFSGDKLEQVYEATNKYILQDGKQAADIHDWTYWQNDARYDTEGVRSLRGLDMVIVANIEAASYNHLHRPRGCYCRRCQVHYPLPRHRSPRCHASVGHFQGYRNVDWYCHRIASMPGLWFQQPSLPHLHIYLQHHCAAKGLGSLRLGYLWRR